MDNLSFAEKRKLFNSKPVMKVGTGIPKVPSVNNELSSDKVTPELPSRLPSNPSQQSMDNDNDTLSDSTASSFQVLSEPSVAQDHKPFSYIPSKKLPSYFEPSSTPENSNGVLSGKKPAMPLPDWVQSNSNANIHSAESASTPENTAGKKPPIPPPRHLDSDRLERSREKSLSISLDLILPLKCMFFDCDDTIRNYRRRDPRTITYSKLKPSMPEMNANEKNLLQRYSDL